MAITLLDEEADELREYLDHNRELQVISHGTYADYPWYGKLHPAAFIRTELGLCERAGISGLVVHLGRPGVGEVMQVLPRLVTPARVLIFLETPHVKPEHAHYETPEKLAILFQEIRKLDPSLCKFGLCIDTAHLWSSGVDLQSFENAESWLRRLEAVASVIPPDRIIFHLNDSFDELGSGVDRHAPLLNGKIWGNYKDRPLQSGLAAFVDYIVRNSSIALLERKPQEALFDDFSVLGRLTASARLSTAEPPR
ncbi:AP endonuclease class II [Elysia marginata]|uniref:AP endonuclease class II n=1 Tax=Elysia marginata TaxID=1093978 RepID=A0AAV4GVU7_9GAST|nr:AP endonuclease class II [Elysia marginata]